MVLLFSIIDPQLHLRPKATMSFTERRSDNSDVGRVWTEAIDQYCKDTRTDPAEFRNMRNLNAIMDEQKRQVDRFESFRHSGKAGDQIRHFVNKNSDIVETHKLKKGTLAYQMVDLICCQTNRVSSKRVIPTSSHDSDRLHM